MRGLSLGFQSFDTRLHVEQSNEINRFYTGVARGLDLEMLLAVGALGLRAEKKREGCP